MYCLPIKAKSIEEMSSKIDEIVNEYYYGCTVHQLGFTRPTDECDWYTCLLLIEKGEE